MIQGMRLLLVEDDFPLADGLVRALTQQGFAVDAVGTCSEALAAIGRQRYDLVVLDLGLPDLDGSEVVRQLAETKADVPVLVLSARDAIDSRVGLLDLGADDYLVKPAVMDEFLARVRAALRRRRLRSGQRIVLGRLTLDVDARRAYVDGEPVDLNSRDWTLLVFMVERANRIVSKEDILAALCGEDESVTANAVEQIMSRFRRRFDDGVLRLRTIRGLGYYLETDAARPGS